MKKLIFTCFAIVASLSGVKAQYAVGDPYEKDGVKSVVIHVSEDGQHGLIMSIPMVDKDNAKQWREEMKKGSHIPFWDNKDNHYVEEIFDRIGDDGASNFRVVEEYCKDHDLLLNEAFPLYGWAKGLGDGWFIPGNRELAYYANFIGHGLGKEAYKGNGFYNFYKETKKRAENLQASGAGYEKAFLPVRIFSSTWSRGGKGLKKNYIHPDVFAMVTWGARQGLAILGNVAIATAYGRGAHWGFLTYPVAVCEF